MRPGSSGFEEAGTAGHPTAAVQRDPFTTHHALQMAMSGKVLPQVLPPGMQM
jgi:hypothetical protein